MNDRREHDPGSVVRQLLRTDRHLAEWIRSEILALDAAAVPALLEFLEDDELAGWAPVHAARLLGELKTVDAVGPMLRALAETEPLDSLHDAVIVSLPEIGKAVVEPALRAYAESDDDEFRDSVASILAHVGVRDERIFAVLVKTLEDSPSHAGDLAHYGDDRAVPYLARAFDAFTIRETDSPLANQDLVELQAAIEDLGGELTSAQSAKFRKALAPAERWRRQLHAAIGSRKADVRPARPGRNEPCWCGSAKKYKKCHLSADENERSTEGLQPRP